MTYDFQNNKTLEVELDKWNQHLDAESESELSKQERLALLLTDNMHKMIEQDHDDCLFYLYS